MPKKIHRFITIYHKTGNTIKINDIGLIHQINDVLKMRTNEDCIIIGTDEIEILCSIKNIKPNYIELEIKEKILQKNNPPTGGNKFVTLYMAILKKENFELVLQKASEIGIHTIVPMITNRTVKTGLNFERLEKIAREASELSGRNTVIKIADITNFSDAILKDKTDTKILFDITGKPANSLQLKSNSLSIYIGPEGGFTDQEIQLAKKNKIEIKNLGQLTLRGETAAIIACYLAMQ
jgi:16S rRNA (uracil1498-N3)-methyltransferase